MASAAVLAGCARTVEDTSYAAALRYFNAWIETYHPEAVKTGSGVYLLPGETVGTGDAWGGSERYAFVHYVARSLDGTITGSDTESVAQQLGTYDPSHYYGPTVWAVGEQGCYAGVEDLLAGMREGGTRQAVIPAWLMTYSRYGSEADYLSHLSDATQSNALYTVTLIGQADDILTWQADSLDRYMKLRYGADVDSTYYGGDEAAGRYGFYFVSLDAGDTDTDIPADSVFYINYTGRLLNGQVFDTTIADTAKVHHIYDASGSYAPISITKGSTYTENTLGDSKNAAIAGFSAALHLMHPYGHAVTAFYSALGYGSSGQGATVPGYAPLQFEITLVDKPE